MLAAEEAPDGFSARRDALSRSLPLPRARPPRRPRRSSAGARCGGRTASTSPRSTRAPPRCPARTTSPPSRRRTPTTGASAATCSRAGWRARGRRARVRDRGRHVHAPHEPRARRDDARGRGRAADARRLRAAAGRAARAPRPARRRRRTGSTSSACATLAGDGRPARGYGAARGTLAGARPPHQRRRHRGGRACRRCAARCSTSRTSSSPSSPRTPTARPSAAGSRRAARCGCEEVDFGDGTVGYATDGTPVDCVRFAALGLVEGFTAELIVSGINHGSNLGDDITYSGTVAAALEGVVLGLPAVAVSQQSAAREMDFRLGERFDFTAAAAFTARVVEEIEDVPLPGGHAAERQRAGRATSAASRSRGSASASTATQLSLEEEDVGPPALPHLRRRAGLPPRGRHRPRRDRRGPHRGHAAALRPDGRAGAGDARRVRPRAAAGARPRDEVE